MCPKCGSSNLLVKQAAGLEKLMIRLTGKRKYNCPNCRRVFRAPDRRKHSRDEAPRGIAAQVD